MFSSVQAGVRALPEEAQAFFVLPVDTPLVRSWTIKQTAQIYQSQGPLVAYPVFQGQRGHPPLISSRIHKAVAEHIGHGGLRRLLQNYDHQALEVDTFDRNILLDLDRPDDLAPAEHRARALSRLDKGEAWTLALNRAGCSVDVELSHVCGLVHDIAKGQPRHEEAGGNILHSMGLADMAPIVAAHRDLALPDDQQITAKEVVYLEDKLTRGPQRVAGGSVRTFSGKAADFQARSRGGGHYFQEDAKRPRGAEEDGGHPWMCNKKAVPELSSHEKEVL